MKNNGGKEKKDNLCHGSTLHEANILCPVWYARGLFIETTATMVLIIL